MTNPTIKEAQADLAELNYVVSQMLAGYEQKYGIRLYSTTFIDRDELGNPEIKLNAQIL